MRSNDQEIVARRLTKAKKTLNETEIHIQNELWNTAVNRLYYACFYAVTALLFQNGQETKTHGGVQRLFSLHFIKTSIIKEHIGAFYMTLFEMRQDADYEDLVEYEREDVLKLLAPARELITAIETEINK
ncbi:HEPN domain-containing protein [Nemorincola caseinilytica]|uniref:HEPN domain-containing protein n=1 Tax=Nemorincola caseinilytica TaxID=2054315 RepID=A0ABP8NSU6_9BACT